MVGKFTGYSVSKSGLDVGTFVGRQERTMDGSSIGRTLGADDGDNIGNVAEYS